VRFAKQRFADERYGRARFARGDGGAKSCPAGPDDEDILFVRLVRP